MRGFWHVIEALIAVTVLVVFLITVGATVLSRTSIEVSDRGFEILKGLDEQGVLRGYVQNNDPYGLAGIINVSGFNHTVEICGLQGCLGEQPSGGENRFVASYIVSGDDFYYPRTVKLYIYTTPD